MTQQQATLTIPLPDGSTATVVLSGTVTVTPPTSGGTPPPVVTPPVVTPPPPVVVTPPVVTPPPVPPHGQRRILWHHGWQGPALGSLPPAVRARLTTVCLAMAQSAKGGTGQLTGPPGVTAHEVASLVADGIDVLVGIGGSGDGGITVTTPTQVADLVSSVQAQRKALGITGICWDLEDTPGQTWTVDAVVAASQQLLDAGLRVGIWSATWGGRMAAWGAVAKALGSRLDHWQRGFYDFPEAGDNRLSGIVAGDFAAMRQYLVSDDQLVASFAAVGSSSQTPTQVMVDAMRAGAATHPTAGWSVWEDYQDSGRQWAATLALGQV